MKYVFVIRFIYQFSKKSTVYAVITALPKCPQVHKIHTGVRFSNDLLER